MQVNMHVSDLFFNQDMQEAVVFDNKGEFDCYNVEVLQREAETFLHSLRMLSVRNLPSPAELIADFLGRV